MRTRIGVRPALLASATCLGAPLTSRSEVEDVIDQGQAAPTGHIPFTPRAKKVLELSAREALQLGHDSIGTEHILLGLIREGEGVAAQVLQKLGADLGRVRQQVIQLLPTYTGKGERQPAPWAPPRVVAEASADLSPQEREVLRLVSQGLSNEEIAARLGISRPSVKTHVHRILRKLGVYRRHDLRPHDRVPL